MATGFAQFYNTSANTSVAAGTTIAARRAAAYVTSTIPDSGPGDSGTLTLFLNDASAGSREFTTGSDNGTYGANLVIADNVDYATKTGAASGFWESFDAYGSGVTKRTAPPLEEEGTLIACIISALETYFKKEVP
jgi:hypothetical protein